MFVMSASHTVWSLHTCGIDLRQVSYLHAVSAYKKRLYKKRLVDGSIVKKRTLVDFYQAKKLVSYIHSQKLLR